MENILIAGFLIGAQNLYHNCALVLTSNTSSDKSLRVAQTTGIFSMVKFNNTQAKFSWSPLICFLAQRTSRYTLSKLWSGGVKWSSKSCLAWWQSSDFLNITKSISTSLVWYVFSQYVINNLIYDDAHSVVRITCCTHASTLVKSCTYP